MLISLEENNPELLKLSVFQLFWLCFDEDVNNLAKSESERHAKQKLIHAFYLPQSDLNAFVGTVLLRLSHPSSGASTLVQ